MSGCRGYTCISPGAAVNTLALMLFLLQPWCEGQEQRPVTVAVAQPSISNLPALPLGPDDLVNVAVYQSPELSGIMRIDAQGRLYLPMLKDPIAAEGLYPKALAGRIEEALSQSQLVVHPVVTVTVAEYQSRTVSVTGAVRHPVSFQAYGDLTLLDAVARAEGVSEAAGDVVLITRHGATDSSRLAERIPLKQLMAGQDASLNLKLRGGEEIRIPEQGRFSVVGNVRKPGLFAIKSEDEATVLNAVAQSEGLLPYSAKHAYIYRLESNRNSKSEIPVSLSQIMERRSPDVPLQAGDILYVPDNKGRRMTLGALDKLLTAGVATSSALVYAGVR